MTTILAPPGHSLPCPRCGSDTNPEYRIDKLGDRYPVWQCLNIDCLYLER